MQWNSSGAGAWILKEYWKTDAANGVDAITATTDVTGWSNWVNNAIYSGGSL